MSICAVIPVANMEAANAALEAAGHGPGCFSVPAWATATLPTFGGLHAWHDPVFSAAVKALAGVIWEEGGAGSPPERFRALVEAQGAGADTPELPDAGMVQPGVYQYDDGLRLIIQAHDRSIYGGDPASRPALARVARDPRLALPWVQPIDQFDAYQIATGFGPERVTFADREWTNTVANNVWSPGVYGWV